MSGDDQRMRFVVRDSGGRERSLATVEDLHDEVAAGRVGIEDEIFDSSTGAWSPAGKIPLFQFIVEELEAEGNLPERLKPPQAPDSPIASGSPSPLPDHAGHGRPKELDRDPLDLSLDLVEAEPLRPDPRGPESGAGASAKSPTDESPPGGSSERTTDAPPSDVSEPPLTTQQRSEPESRPPEDDDFRIRPGSALDDDWKALRRDSSSIRKRDREPGPDRIEFEGERPGMSGFPSVDGDALDSPRRSDRSDGSDTRDDEAVPWQPDAGDQSTGSSSMSDLSPAVRRASRPSGKMGRGGLIAAAVGSVLILAGGWFVLTGGGSDEPGGLAMESAVPASPPPPTVPPPPAGSEDQVQAGLRGVEDRFLAVKDSLRAELELAPAPPRVWLGGAYLADATAFPEVRDFWEGYHEFLHRVQPIDGQTYMAGVEAGLAGSWEDGEIASLRAYFEERYSRIRSHRMARFESLGAVTRAALNLHDVLARHNAQISFSPAVGRGVSADPILEAVIPDGPVRQEVEAALDQVFRALDRSRGGGIPSMDGLRSELFERFGEG